MVVGYVKQKNVPVKWIDKIKYFFNVIEIEQLEKGVVIRLPICEKDIEKKAKKIVEKLLCKIQKYKIEMIIFSDKLSTKNKSGIIFSEEFETQKVNYLQQKEQKKEKKLVFQIASGRKIIEYMQFHIFEYILKIQGKDIRQEEVYFLIKRDSKMDFSFLDKFIRNCKTVNIITNDIERFKKIQHNLYEQENILIGLSNNKNKALKRAKYIFNINMEKKDIEKLKIYRNAIIINITKAFQYNSNCFQGININQIEIKMPDEYMEELEKINKFDEDKLNSEKFYEAILLEKLKQEKDKELVQTESYIQKSYLEVANQIIQQDEIKIKNVIGNNGIIQIEEFIKNKLYETNKK